MGQVAIIGSVVFSSLSSTALLNYITKPYISQLFEVKNEMNELERKFRAKRIDWLGRPKYSEFTLTEVEKKSSHPYGSFQLKSTKESYYIHGPDMTDKKLRELFGKE
jgi:hypothetical protein